MRAKTRCLQPIKKLLLFLLFYAIQASLFAQNKVMSGTITAEDNSPVQGATVVRKAGGASTTTNRQGRFSIEASRGDVLLVTHVAYENMQYTIGSEAAVNIALKPTAATLADVVVVGYGTQKRKAVTTAVSTIRASDFDQVPVANVSRMLQGQAAGVTAKQNTGRPGREFEVSIRGLSSLGASSSPLYVVDGFPVGTSLGVNLNPNDIETLTVLKDAASTAIYGARGANGVVLITTKSARAGVFKVNANVNYGVQNVPSSRRINTFNGPEFAQFKKEVFMDKIRALENREPAIDEVPISYRFPEQTTTSTDWYKEILNTDAAFQNFNLSFTGGSEKLSSFISTEYLKQEGALKFTGFERYSLRSNIDSRVKEFLNVGLRFAGSYTRENRGDADAGIFGNNIVEQALLMDPRFPVYNPDGSFNKFIGGVDGVFGFPNPVMRLKEEINRFDIGNILGNSYIELKPLRNLSYKTLLNASFTSLRNQSFIPSTVGGFASPPPSVSRGAEVYNQILNVGLDNLLTYTPRINEHQFEVLAGHSVQKETTNTARAGGNQFPNNVIPFVSAANETNGTAGEAAWSLEAYFGRVNYSLKDRYLLSASMRREGSSRFGRITKWGNFPSASFGWIVSEEDFFPETSWLTNLKLRGSYGITGNNNIGNYNSLSNIIAGNYVLNNSVAPGALVGVFANQSLAWETSRQYNFGLDFSFFNNRLSFISEFYRKLTTDMLLPMPIPGYTGFTTTFSNVGEVENSGLEFTLLFNNSFGKNVRVNSNFNIGFNRNKVLEIDGISNEILTGDIYGGYNKSLVGRPIGMLWGFVVEGIYQNQAQIDATPHHPGHIPGTYQYRDISGDGEINYDTRDITEIGNPHPKFVWGWNASVSVKRLELSVLVNGAHRYDLDRLVERFTMNVDGVFNVQKDMVDRWRSEKNPGRGIQSGSNTFMFTREANSRYIYDASHTWIRNISLAYTLPAIRHLSDVRVFASVDNAFLITKYFGNNPESNGDGGIRPGRDYETHPVPRVFTVGTKINL